MVLRNVTEKHKPLAYSVLIAIVSLVISFGLLRANSNQQTVVKPSNTPNVAGTVVAPTPKVPDTLGLSTTNQPTVLSPIPFSYDSPTITTDVDQIKIVLGSLAVKGRAPKTGYSRAQFGKGWNSIAGCSTRQSILKRDLTDITLNANNCSVQSGKLLDPYSNITINFTAGKTTSDAIQIDHVVPLSNAWQTGAQQFDKAKRIQFANDHLNLLAVDGKLNNQKGDADSATWLPPNKPGRCAYVTRQILVKAKYSLWVTQPEFNAMQQILQSCPSETFSIIN